MRSIVILGVLMMITTQGYSSQASFLVNLLRRHNADHWFSERKDREFCYAIEWGNTNKMAKMLKEGIDINKIGKNGMNFLIYSYLRKNKKSYKFLLENGADPNLFMLTDEKVPGGPRLDFYESVLSFAAADDDPFYLEVALKNGGDPNLGKPTEDGDKIHIMYTAVSSGNLTNVQLLVEYGADVNAGEKVGSVGSPLRAAISLGYFDIAYYLLQKGANTEIAKESIIREINSFSIAERKITKEQFIKMGVVERSSFLTLERIEYRDKVIEILESKGYTFPERVKKWNWTNN